MIQFLVEEPARPTFATRTNRKSNSRLTADEYHLVLPDSRRLVLFTSEEDVIIGDVVVHVDVHASPSVDKRLAGRSFLQSFAATLDGRREELELRLEQSLGSNRRRRSVG